MWYSLRLEGMVFDLKTERPVHLISGCPSLEGLLNRLRERLERGIDGTEGKFPNGLQAALSLQLGIGQWDNWNSFRACERALGACHPSILTAVNHARGCGS